MIKGISHLPLPAGYAFPPGPNFSLQDTLWFINGPGAVTDQPRPHFEESARADPQREPAPGARKRVRFDRVTYYHYIPEAAGGSGACVGILRAIRSLFRRGHEGDKSGLIREARLPLVGGDSKHQLTSRPDRGTPDLIGVYGWSPDWL